MGAYTYTKKIMINGLTMLTEEMGTIRVEFGFENRTNFGENDTSPPTVVEF